MWWCHLLSCRGKRSINYPAQGKPYSIFPPLERRDLWDVSVDGSPYTVVRAYPNFDPNPGYPGRHVWNKTRASISFERNVQSGIRIRVLDDAKCDGATYWATGVNDRSITQPRVSLITNSTARFWDKWFGNIVGCFFAVTVFFLGQLACN